MNIFEQIVLSIGIGGAVVFVASKIIKPLLIKKLLLQNDTFQILTLRNGSALLWKNKFPWYFGFPEFDLFLNRKKQECPNLEVVGCFTRKGNYVLATWEKRINKFDFSKIKETEDIFPTSDCILITPNLNHQNITATELRQILERAQV